MITTLTFSADDSLDVRYAKICKAIQKFMGLESMVIKVKLETDKWLDFRFVSDQTIKNTNEVKIILLEKDEPYEFPEA